MNKPKLSCAGLQSRGPREARDCRNSPVHLATLATLALALACSSVTPIERAVEGAPDATADSNPDNEAPSWCAVRAILAQRCQRCHGTPPAYGAPFELISYEDTQVLDRKGNARFVLIAQAIERRTMPAQYIKLEPPVLPLQDEERAIILSWCANGGMMASKEVCEPSP